MNPQWIDLSVVLAIHEQQIAEHGGALGIRDLGMIESALGRPQNVFLLTIFHS
jgi:death-on-curing protein